AGKMADQSAKIQETFGNMMTRAMVLEKKGNTKGAGELRAKAVGIANENEMNQYGYQLLFQKKVEEAIAIFQKNVAAHPESWNVHDSLGEGLAVKGDKTAAYEGSSKALRMVKDPVKKKRIQPTLVQLKN